MAAVADSSSFVAICRCQNNTVVWEDVAWHTQKLKLIIILGIMKI